MLIKCPRCEIEMEYDQEKKFWWCCECKGEWWENEEYIKECESVKRNKEAREQIEQQLRWSIGKRYTEVQPTGYVPTKKKSSSKSGKKRKKKPKRGNLRLFMV